VKPVRIGVIGAGAFGRHHVRLLSEHPDAELVLVADANVAAREAVAQAFGVDTVSDHRELIGRVDAAVLAVPTHLHHQLGSELLSAGIHLMIEKPLAANASEGAELVEIARQQGRVLQVGHIERFNPALEVALPHVERPKLIEARRTAPHRFRSTDIGVVLDLMIHDLDVVLSLNDSDVQNVQAMGLALFGRHEDVAQARLTFADGCVVSLTASRASYELSRVVQIWSESGFASIDFDRRVTSVVKPSDTVSDRKVDAECLSPAEREYLMDHLFDELLPLERIEAPERNQLQAEIDDFLESVRLGRRPRVSGEHGLRALEVADQILAAIDRHAWDGSADGRFGPHLTKRAHVLDGPHWLRRTAPNQQRREAG